ncbi:MAG TPA: PorV/PorQ family protein, partial [Firmicutes bacterium]|nr:PorV/PorQ family protein [Bacillota bacterium]
MFRGAVITILFFIAFSSFAGPWGIPMEAFNKDVGIRASGMGGAYAADSADASAYYWNPAVLDEISQNIFFTSFESFMEGADSEVLSFAAPAGRHGGFGMGIGIINYGSYEAVNINGSMEGEDHYRDITAVLGYGRHLFFGIKGGLSIKTIMRKTGPENYTGFNTDMGFYKSFGRDFAAGLSFKNIIPAGIAYSDSEEKFVSSARLGLSFRFLDEKLTVNTDIEKYFIDVIPVWSLGAEYRIFDILLLRAGVNAIADRNNLSGGIGVEYGGFVFDYAVVAAEEMVSHKAGISYAFGGYDLLIKPEPAVFSPVGGNRQTYLRLKAETKYD